MADVRDVEEFKASKSEKAFTRIYHRWDEALRNTAKRKYIINPHDTDDFMQDFWVKVHTYLHTFKGHSSLNTWLHKVLYNQGMDYQRELLTRRHTEGMRLHFNLEGLGADPSESEWENVEGPVDATNNLTDSHLSMLEEAFERAAARIPERCLGPWKMSHEGCSYEEMAEHFTYAYKTLREYVYMGNIILKEEIHNVTQRADDHTTDGE